MRISVLIALLVGFLPEVVLAQTATYYSTRLAGRRMANGRPYNPGHLVAAHPSYPIGTRLRVTNRKTGRSVVVTVSDRCRCSLDLSSAAFRQIANKKHGRVNVAVTPL